MSPTHAKNTIAIFASSRSQGNTRQFMDWIANELAIEVIDLADQSISPYDYEHRNMDDDFLPLMRHVLKHQNIIIASPVYWYSVSAQMKVFIDRTSDFLAVDELKAMGRQLRGKTAYVVCTSISEEVDPPFIAALKDTVEYLGMTFGGYAHADCGQGYRPEQYQEDVDKFVELISSS